MDKKEEDIGSILVESLRESGLTDLPQDIAEVGLDAFLDEGIVKELPVIKTVVSFFRTGICLRDALFLKKVSIFLSDIGKIPQQKRDDFIKRLNSTHKQKRRVGNTLILILERLDDLDKPAILAKCFIAYLNEIVTFEEFRRLAIAIDRAYVSDLHDFLKHFRLDDSGRLHVGYRGLPMVFPALMGTGLVELSSEMTVPVDKKGDGSEVDVGPAEIDYDVTGIGWSFAKIMLDVKETA